MRLLKSTYLKGYIEITMGQILTNEFDKTSTKIACVAQIILNNKIKIILKKQDQCPG